jgi:chromate transporter
MASLGVSEPCQQEAGNPKLEAVSYFRLFWEWFKIALFVVGGGYAIIVVADEVFGRKLKWLRDGELIEHLPIISSIPGLIAGNSAIYVGLKTRGRLGALVALAGVALPSIIIFLAVTVGFDMVPRGNRWIDGAFLGLRSALSGVIAAAIWRAVFKSRLDWSKGVGVPLPPLSAKGRIAALLSAALCVALAAAFAWESMWSFMKFGCVAIGGGFPLIPFYFHSFVGPAAPMLNLSAEDFSNLMALTQMTPGPVSLNAATFFGFRLNGVFGSLVASAALLTPSYILLIAVLTGLDRWRQSRVVKCLLSLLKPVSVALMAVALYRFLALSVWGWSEGGEFVFRPFACALAAFTAVMQARRWMSIMALIFLCAALGAASACL